MAAFKPKINEWWDWWENGLRWRLKTGESGGFMPWYIFKMFLQNFLCLHSLLCVRNKLNQIENRKAWPTTLQVTNSIYLLEALMSKHWKFTIRTKIHFILIYNHFALLHARKSIFEYLKFIETNFAITITSVKSYKRFASDAISFMHSSCLHKTTAVKTRA